MYPTLLLGATLAFASSAFAAVAQSFQPPASSPEASSGNYTGQSNGTISNGPLVPGKVFDRFIQIWIENTDCESSLHRSQSRALHFHPPRGFSHTGDHELDADSMPFVS